jgi:hypothetical protein
MPRWKRNWLTRKRGTGKGGNAVNGKGGAPELSDSRSSHIAQVLGVLLERIQFEE